MTLPAYRQPARSCVGCVASPKSVDAYHCVGCCSIKVSGSALLTTRLANMGNLEAYILTGLHPIFVKARRSLMPPIERLEHSTKAGHKLGMNVFTLVLYRPNTGGGNDDIAQCLLRELEGADKAGLASLPWKNQTYTWCCKDVHRRL